MVLLETAVLGMGAYDLRFKRDRCGPPASFCST